MNRALYILIFSFLMQSCIGVPRTLSFSDWMKSHNKKNIYNDWRRSCVNKLVNIVEIPLEKENNHIELNLSFICSEGFEKHRPVLSTELLCRIDYISDEGLKHYKCTQKDEVVTHTCFELDFIDEAGKYKCSQSGGWRLRTPEENTIDPLPEYFKYFTNE